MGRAITIRTDLGTAADLRRMAKQTQPWFLYHCTRGAHFDNYPHERFLGKSPAKHPYKDTLIEHIGVSSFL